MNAIVKKLTPDGLVGWDDYNQLWHWTERNGDKIGHIIGDTRGKICPVCQQGWIETADSLGDQHYWRDREEWCHLTCFVRYLAMRDYDLFFDALCGKFRFEKLQPIPNGYWGQADLWGRLRPWYSAKVLDHDLTITLGSRKRVYSIAMSGEFDEPLAESLFRSEDVTKGFSKRSMHVHAWTEADLNRYLQWCADAAKVALSQSS